MRIPDVSDVQEKERWAYENALTEYYAWQKTLKSTKKGSGCPICGRIEKGLAKYSKHAEICQNCADKILDHKSLIEDHLYEKTMRGEKVSSHEIPFLVALSDEDKYKFLYRLLEQTPVLGKKTILELVRTFIAYLQIPCDTAYFYEEFYPVFLKAFTAEPGLVPIWCADVPIGMKEVKKPGEMIHYIDTMIVYDQKTVFKKKKSGKLFTLTWGRDHIYSHAKEGEDTNWEFFEKYRGMIVITSERVIPLLPDGTYPFVFLNARISNLKMIPEGVEIILDGHDRPYRISGLNETRGENIRFCMERLVKKGTVIEYLPKPSE